MMHEPQSFEMEITHADGKVVKMELQTGGGPADEKFVEDHFRHHYPDAKSIAVRKAGRDLSGEAAAVVAAHGQPELAKHLQGNAAPQQPLPPGLHPATAATPAAK